MRTLYIGGLPPDTDEAKLEALFAPFPGLTEVRVVRHPTGVCRGFGYVTFADDLVAHRARTGLDGAEHGDGRLRVAVAR